MDEHGRTEAWEWRERALHAETERDRLQAGVQGTVLAIESILTDDHHDMGVSTSELLGRVSAALQARLDPIEAVADLERERSARQAVDQALRDAVKERDRLTEQLAHEMNVGQSMEGNYHDLKDERDRLRAVIATVLDGLAGPESEDAVAALTSEHVDALKAVVRPPGEST